MQNQAITFPNKTGLRAIQRVSRLVVLSLRLLDIVVLLLFAGAIFYLLGTVLP